MQALFASVQQQLQLSENNSWSDNECREANVTRFSLNNEMKSLLEIKNPGLTVVHSNEQRRQQQVERNKVSQRTLLKPDNSGSFRQGDKRGAHARLEMETHGHNTDHPH